MKKPSSAHGRAILAAVVGYAIGGLTFLVTKIALNAADQTLGGQSAAVLLLAVRFLAAAVGMLILYAFRRPKKSRQPRSRRGCAALAVATVLALVYYFVETASVEQTTSSLTGAVLAVIPVFSIFPGWWLLHEKPSLPQLLTALVPIAGVLMLTVAGRKMGILTWIGLLLLLITCTTSAFYKVFNRFSSTEFSPFERSLAACVLQAVVFTVLALVQYDFQTQIVPLLTNMRFLLPALATAFCSTILAEILVNYAAAKMTVMECASYGAVTTIVSAVGGALLLHEPMTLWSWIGAALATGGVWLLTRQFGKDSSVQLQ